MTQTGSPAVLQAWIEPRSDDPEALSAWSVARARLSGARGLAELRRARLVEIRGSRRAAVQAAELLHASTQFYNPHKERCTLRTSAGDPVPAAADARLLRVRDVAGDRRPAAERWWRHETGEEVEVREATVWMLRVEPGADAAACAEALGVVRDARHGLLCNRWSQTLRVSAVPPPLPWIEDDTIAGEGGGA